MRVFYIKEVFVRELGWGFRKESIEWVSFKFCFFFFGGGVGFIWDKCA